MLQCNIVEVRLIFVKYSHRWRICSHASVEPVKSLGFFQSILRESLLQHGKIDRIERLILGLAAEDKSCLPSFGVA